MSDISERLKAKGLDIAEDAVKAVVEELEILAKEKLEASSNPMVKGIGLMALPFIMIEIDKAVDKIDGEIG